MADPARCPYCNQPLVSSDAIAHLHRTEEKLRRELADEATAAAEKKVEAARNAAEKKVRAEAERERSKRERGLQRMIDTLQRQNDDLERRLTNLSAPTRGDLNESDVAQELVAAFPEDEITRKGKGGDIVQVVRYRTDHEFEPAGVILYECKDTARWSNAFIRQIRTDGRALGTPYLILITRTLPANEKDTCIRDDVVITDPAHARHLARILRRVVIETYRAERAGHDRDRKTAHLYEYLRSDDFRERLASVVEAGSKLTGMLQSERRGHERDWNSRQRTYDEVLHNSVAIEQSIQRITESERPSEAAPNSAKKRQDRRSRTERLKLDGGVQADRIRRS